MLSARSIFLSASVAVTLIACGGSSGDSLFQGGADGTGAANGSGTGAGNGASGDLGGFSTDPVGTSAACVTSKANVTLPAVNLIMMYDKSGSMGDPLEGGDPTVKWIPVNTGMKAFFSDPASAGYNTSLQFFPAPGDMNTTCNAPYATPLVALTSLATSQPLIAALDGASPQGGTPTLPALKGAIAYARQTMAARPNETTVVVLVTDGEPGLFVNGQMQPGCTDNDISHVADAAAAAFEATPPLATYVVGVGPSLSKLNAIAKAGGTKQAFVVPVSNPQETTTELQKALESIRSQVKLSCDFALPAAPEGQILDKSRVNVAFTAGSGQETPLVYSSDCSAANGWHYDNLAAPTRVELCAATCSAAQSDRGGKLTTAFGCITNGAQK